MKLMMLVLLGCLSLSGCGQKGPLYKSPEPETNKASTPKSQSNIAATHQTQSITLQ